MINIIISILGVLGITLLLVKVFHLVYRTKMVYIASGISREIQKLDVLPKPTLRSLVQLVEYLTTKRKDIEEQLDKMEQDNEDKYRNIYG